MAVLTRALGTRRLDLVEDVVQSALAQALQTWARRGVPAEPAAWLFRTARNLAIDALRRERAHHRILQAIPQEEVDVHPEIEFAQAIGDEPLRLLFVCCHEDVPFESRVALALKSLCGFSTAEIARALLTTEANVQKRIERARDRLRECEISFDDQVQPGPRLDAVVTIIYLMFGAGCHASHAEAPIRRDLCDEARRLARLLANHAIGNTPTVHALLALICFHSARFDARVAFDGRIILLEDQDRTKWNWSDVREGMTWLRRAATGSELSRYHIEAAIAWEHCRARTFSETDWARILELYGALSGTVSSPLHTLNRAVAAAHLHGPRAGLTLLNSTAPAAVPRHYPAWHAVRAELHFRLGEHEEAHQSWVKARDLSASMCDRIFIEDRLGECQRRLGKC